MLPVTFPYIPGLFAFREGPLVIEALGRLTSMPNLVMIDGHLYSPPQRFGLATHVGAITGTPTIGIAKNLLCGSAAEPGKQRGSISPVMMSGEMIGMAVRTRTSSRPLYISSGYRSDLRLAVELVMLATKHSRMPVPHMVAHHQSGLGCQERKNEMNKKT